jgi:antitoxin component of RelBE/YafQ-DinJ toxin-antitoxin module
MNKIAITIKMDRGLKEELRAFAEDIGLSLSSAINVLAKQAVMKRSITLDAPIVPTDYLNNLIIESDNDQKRNRNVRTFKSKNDLISHLESL